MTLSKSKKLNSKEVDILSRKISERVVTKEDEPNIKVVLIGGAALYYHNMRDSFNDYDCLLVSSGQIIGDNDDFLDMSGDQFAYCELLNKSMEESQNVLSSVSVKGRTIDVVVPDLESLLIQKMYMPRAVDADDICRLLESVTPGMVIEKFNSLVKENHKSTVDWLASQVISEMSIHLSMAHPDKSVNSHISKWLVEMNIDDDTRSDLRSSFGIQEDFLENSSKNENNIGEAELR